MAPVRLSGARVHLVHGRVCVTAAPATGGGGGCGSALTPLEAELRLVRRGATLGATRTRADGSYTLLFNASLWTASSERVDGLLWLHVLSSESDPCKRVNVTRRCSFARELEEVGDAESVWIWHQTLEIDARDAFPGCPHSVEHTMFHGLQAHEFRDALLAIGRRAVGDVPFSLSEAAIAFCYGVFFLLLCALLRTPESIYTAKREGRAW